MALALLRTCLVRVVEIKKDGKLGVELPPESFRLISRRWHPAKAKEKFRPTDW